MKLILISGKAQHGKDSTANMLKEKLEKQNKKVLIAHYGDLVKYVCKTFFDWNGEKDEAGRTLLQQIGTNKIRAAHPNFWVDFVKSILNIFYYEWDYVLIPDTRFPNEIDAYKRDSEYWDLVSVRVNRTNFESTLSKEQQEHISEIALDYYKFDYYLDAVDLKELEILVDRLVERLEEK